MRKRLIGQVRVVIGQSGIDTNLRTAGYYEFQDVWDVSLPHKGSFVDYFKSTATVFDLVLGCDRSESADIYALMGDDAEVITKVVHRGN